MNKRLSAIEELQIQLGHQFADGGLLERALTHASVGGGGTKIDHNERLEFRSRAHV